MNRGTRAFVTLLAGGAAVAYGATSRNLDVPAPAALPALIHTIEPSADDSRLVRAAKLTVAARLRDSSARLTSETVNDEYMKSHRGGHMSQGSSTTWAGRTAADGTIYVAPPAPDRTDPAPIEAKREKLRDEQARAGAEQDEPYGGNYGMEEDQSERRATQTPEEIQRTNRQLEEAGKATPTPPVQTH